MTQFVMNSNFCLKIHESDSLKLKIIKKFVPSHFSESYVFMKKNNQDSEISLYLNYLNDNKLSESISGRSMSDLNFDELFDYIDHTTSKVGQQYFYAKLCAMNLGPYSNEHERITNKFSTDPDFALQTEKLLKKLGKREAYNIISLFSKELPTASNIYLFFINILRFVPVTFALLLFVFHLNFCIYLLMVSLIVNMAIHYMNKKVQMPFEYAIPQLLILMKCSEKLSKDVSFSALSNDILKHVNTLRPVSKSSTLFNVENALMSDAAQFVWLILELLKIVTLTEPYLFHKTIRLIRGKQNEMKELYCFIGLIDSLLAISKIRSSEVYSCIPSIDEKNEKLSFSGLYHPLIEGCVSNSLSVNRKSILLTGSNMSGKSTFIRTVGVNILLAQNINTCFAQRFGLKKSLILQSMITVGDDLMNSKSLFFEEVLIMKEMLTSSEKGQHIYLLDEIFKGTNTLERISAAKAVLSHLIKNGNIVFVSTHDIELTELLDSEYDLYHFCEHFQDGEVVFDYLLKNGKLSAFNAIKILKMSGYANEIIEEAYRTVTKLTNKKEEFIPLSEN